MTPFLKKTGLAVAMAVLFVPFFFSAKRAEGPLEKRGRAILHSEFSILHSSSWGFFAHRRINRYATLTLPPEMGIFFKKNLDWLTEHATAPDLRRYLDPHEAPRHFIDLDRWPVPPPSGWAEALLFNSEWWAVLDGGDTVRVFVAAAEEQRGLRFDTLLPIWEVRKGSLVRLNSLNIKQLSDFWRNEMLPKFYEDEWPLHIDSLQNWFDQSGLGEHCVNRAWAVERLTEHGILPWHLSLVQHRLTRAFVEKDAKKVLQLAADLGHYIADAHVPLHTTSNYDGQKTGQNGLHAFWETRLPELFAEKTWDHLVDKPMYLEDPPAFFWATVMESHRLADSVFIIEKSLRATFPADLQLVVDERNGLQVLTPSRELAAAFERGLGGSVERRFREAIRAVASAWYTAWVDAGQPDLSGFGKIEPSTAGITEVDSLAKAVGTGRFLGRPENN